MSNNRGLIEEIMGCKKMKRYSAIKIILLKNM